jgi:hypothetical protein
MPLLQTSKGAARGFTHTLEVILFLFLETRLHEVTVLCIISGYLTMKYPGEYSDLRKSN